jgi:hypothetical protein
MPATASQLVGLIPNTRLFAPETVGWLLRHHRTGLPTTDFARWPAWRPLVVATAAELAEQTGQHLIAPQLSSAHHQSLSSFPSMPRTFSRLHWSQ